MSHRFGDGRDWFFQARFGLFIHWGLYAIPAWHEQIMYRKQIPRQEYAKLMHQFNPAHFDPDAWLDLAEEAGMRYLIFTTKHIDGFCMWDTAQTDYKVTNTPFGKDVVQMLADACHKRNFPLCLYYSKVDEHHPNFPNTGGPYELPGPDPGDEPDLARYHAYMFEQIRELCSNYGEIHGIWWDCKCFERHDPSFNQMIRELQPKAMINDRGPSKGDFSTVERDFDPSVSEILAFDEPMEACQAVGSQSWSFRKDEDYFSDRYLMESIDRAMAKGANYLLNVGPMADGVIDPQSSQIVRAVGTWYHLVKEAFEDSQPVSHLTANRDVLLTRRQNTLYVHLYKPPHTTAVILNPITVLPRKATLLNTGQSVETQLDLLPQTQYNSEGHACLRLRNLPVNELANTVLVVKLEFDKFPEFKENVLSQVPVEEP